MGALNTAAMVLGYGIVGLTSAVALLLGALWLWANRPAKIIWQRHGRGDFDLVLTSKHGINHRVNGVFGLQTAGRARWVLGLLLLNPTAEPRQPTDRDRP